MQSTCPTLSICKSPSHVKYASKLVQGCFEDTCLPGCLKVGIGGGLALLVMQCLVGLALFEEITDLQLQQD